MELNESREKWQKRYEAVVMGPRVTACALRGEKIGERECQTCGGVKMLSVFACKHHPEGVVISHECQHCTKRSLLETAPGCSVPYGEKCPRFDLVAASEHCLKCKDKDAVARAEAVQKLRVAQLTERPMISICINAHNEEYRTRLTVKDLHVHLGDYPHEFVIVADEVTDGGCDYLEKVAGAAKVTVIRNSKRAGCGKAKRQAMAAASGDVLMFFDAHMNVIAGSLAELALKAWREEAIWTPVVRNIRYVRSTGQSEYTAEMVDKNNQIPNRDGMLFDKAQYRVLSNAWCRENHGCEIAMVGVGFAASRKTLERMGGFNGYRGLHGSQERGISLRAWAAGIPVKLDASVTVGHEFRAGKPKPRGYKRYTTFDQAWNYWHAFYVVAGNEAFEQMRPILLKKASMGGDALKSEEAQSDRAAFLPLRKRTDDELLTLLGIPRKAVVMTAGGWDNPKIDVRIPFEPKARLGKDYNRIMRESQHEWVLILDHDVLLLHPNWYQVAQTAIRKHPEAGLITCWTNNIGCKDQLMPDAPKGHDIAEHRARAKAIWQHYGTQMSLLKRNLMGGFFMLTSKRAWALAGGFPEDSFFGLDNEYHRRILKAGLSAWRINGLYCYHIRERRDGQWIDGVETSSTIARHRTPLELARSPKAVEPAEPAPGFSIPKKRVVYSVLTGDYDPILPHVAAPGWDFILFTDNKNPLARNWQVRQLDIPQGMDLRTASRLPKILPHKYLPEYQYSLYVDANMRIYRDPTMLVAKRGWPAFGTVKHPFRDCVFAELRAIAALGKSDPAPAQAQAARYQAAGMPEHFGLYECGVLYRAHMDPRAITINEAWWQEFIASETKRDQPALSVALWKTKERVVVTSCTDRTRYLRLRPHDTRDTQIQRKEAI